MAVDVTCLGCLSAAVLGLAPAPFIGESAKELQQLQGEWVLIYPASAPLSPLAGKATIRIDGRRMAQLIDGKPSGEEWELSFRKKAGRLQLVRRRVASGRLEAPDQCIYSREGDNLSFWPRTPTETPGVVWQRGPLTPPPGAANTRHLESYVRLKR